MKQGHKLGWVLAVLVGIGGASAALACDKHDESAAKAKGAKGAAAVFAAASGASTGEKAAACRSAHAASAVTAAAGGCPHARTGAVTADGGPCPYAKATAAGGKDCCAVKGAARTTAATARAPKASAVAAGSSCGVQKSAAATAGAGCDVKARGAKGATAALDCDWCDSWSLCDEMIKGAGANTQMVKLKNGIVFIYSAPSPGASSAVQAAVSQRSVRDDAILRTGARSALCPECKTLRGAIASGRITREVVNIEGGAMAVMTSTDPKIVARFHSWIADAKTATGATASVKS
jgi:hypothetical protein